MRLTMLAVSIIVLFHAPLVRAQEETLDWPELMPQIQTYLEKAESHGFHGTISILGRDGKAIFEGAYGTADDASGDPFASATAVDLGSIGKSFTAAAILLLEEDGALSVDDRLGDIFPNAPADKADITLHQLLTHTAGLPDELGEADEKLTRDEMVQQILAADLLFTPGERFEYSDIGYALLAAVADHTAGKGFRDFVRARIFEPANLENTEFLSAALWDFNGGDQKTAKGYNNSAERGSPADEPVKKGWTLLGGGPILSTAEDGAKWLWAINNDKVLSRPSREKMFGRHVLQEPDYDKLWYGYGWNVYVEPNYRGRAISHSGATASHNFYIQFLQDYDFYMSAASNRIDGEYIDIDGDGQLSFADEVISETIYATKLSGGLARAIIKDDFVKFEAPFMRDKDE